MLRLFGPGFAWFKAEYFEAEKWLREATFLFWGGNCQPRQRNRD